MGCIQSWDVNYGWQSEGHWQFQVIIDNMMNLELLFEVSKFTGDPPYKDIAIAHANTTMKNHFRADYSSVHVVDYDSITGVVRSKQTAMVLQMTILGHADKHGLYMAIPFTIAIPKMRNTWNWQTIPPISSLPTKTSQKMASLKGL
ncbi:MAG: hypothetical protein ABI263_06560 [Gelidibacter sp.]